MTISLSRPVRDIINAFLAALSRLDKSLSPLVTLQKIAKHNFTLMEIVVYTLQVLLASYWMYVMEVPGLPLKLLIPFLYFMAVIIPVTSQFIWNATPVLIWVLTFYSNKFIPVSHRPPISVSVLPTLESVLYGGNISDILTRFTHPLLDILAWLPYGVLHFILPFVVAIFLWLFRPNPIQPGPHEALRFWARAFGYMNLFGVLFGVLFPCAAPWYELIYGLTPASYSVRGSAAGLARIDTLTHSHFYANTFATSPLVFGAFPSLHSACATIEALFWVHFFPYTSVKWIVGIYTATLYWSTMYLSHHYLIDVVGGACLAVAFFYAFIPETVKNLEASSWSAGSPTLAKRSGRSKRDLYSVDMDLENGLSRSRSRSSSEGSSSSMLDTHDSQSAPMNYYRYPTSSTMGGRMSPTKSSDEEEDIAMYRSPHPSSAQQNGFMFSKGVGSGYGVNGGGGRSAKDHGHGHNHNQHTRTASIASLTRADGRPEEMGGWSPIVTSHPNGQNNPGRSPKL